MLIVMIGLAVVLYIVIAGVVWQIVRELNRKAYNYRDANFMALYWGIAVPVSILFWIGKLIAEKIISAFMK